MIASLFAGIGGFDLGFQKAGFKTAMFCEINDAPADVMTRRFPAAKREKDVSELNGKTYRGTVQLVCGGFPCQDVSIQGHRAGLDGDRTGLFFAAMAFVRDVGARTLVLENVPGLLTSNGGRDFRRVLCELEKHGFWWAYRVLDSRWFGVPTIRRRVFIVADSGSPAVPLSLFDGGEMRVLSPSYSRHEVDSSRKVIGTLDTRGKGRQGQWSNLVIEDGRVRDLTRHERELAMGFPQGWTDGISDAQSAKATGNAVPPPMAEWVANQIQEANS